VKHRLSYHDWYLLNWSDEIGCDAGPGGACPADTDWFGRRYVKHYESMGGGFYRFHIDDYLCDHPAVACPEWGSSVCLVSIHEHNGNGNAASNATVATTDRENYGKARAWIASLGPGFDFWKQYKQLRGHPVPVDAPPEQRLREVYHRRKGLCVYGTSMASQKYYHMRDDAPPERRIMAHWHDYLFFEDWREDLWAKRFVRDNLKYNDVLQCSAARIVRALRQLAENKNNNNNNDGGGGSYHSMHIRRTDLTRAYKKFDVERNASQIVDLVTKTRNLVPRGSIVYVATDETDRSFFDVFRDHYEVYFLEDFVHLLNAGVHPDQHGMIDQLVASRGERFIGTYFSTFTGYINRLRGYHSQKKTEPCEQTRQQQQIQTQTKRQTQIRRQHHQRTPYPATGDHPQLVLLPRRQGRCLPEIRSPGRVPLRDRTGDCLEEHRLRRRCVPARIDRAGRYRGGHRTGQLPKGPACHGRSGRRVAAAAAAATSKCQAANELRRGGGLPSLWWHPRSQRDACTANNTRCARHLATPRATNKRKHHGGVPAAPRPCYAFSFSRSERPVANVSKKKKSVFFL